MECEEIDEREGEEKDENRETERRGKRNGSGVKNGVVRRKEWEWDKCTEEEN